jgi:hypothetical protein
MLGNEASARERSGTAAGRAAGRKLTKAPQRTTIFMKKELVSREIGNTRWGKKNVKLLKTGRLV